MSWKNLFQNTFLASESDRCCFRIGSNEAFTSDAIDPTQKYGPCCLEIISCDDYDNVFQDFEDGAIIDVGGGKMDMLGRSIGEHEQCPKDANEAKRLIDGINFK